MSNVPRPPREPEWVGPDTSREDMTGRTERQITLRGLHESLMTRADVQLWIQQHLALEKRVEGIHGHIVSVDARVVTLERHRGAGSRRETGEDLFGHPPPMRDKEDSIHEFDAELRAMRRDMAAKVNDPHHPISESSALAIFRTEAARVKEATELGTWRAVKRFAGTGVGQALSLAWKFAVGGALGWIVHYVMTR